MTRHAGTFTITIVLISLSSFSASLAQGLQISDVIDAVNARLSAFKLIGVPLPQILDFPATAIYEMRRISNDAPAVQFKPREYVLPYNLTQDPKKYSVGDFCTAIRYTKDPSELKLVNAVRRLRNDRENEMARLAEQGILEVALGAYVVTANLFDAGHRSIISLLGTAVDDFGENLPTVSIPLPLRIIPLEPSPKRGQSHFCIESPKRTFILTETISRYPQSSGGGISGKNYVADYEYL